MWTGVYQATKCSHNLSIVKPTRCAIFEFIEYHSTCFGRSFHPSSGVQDCTQCIKYMSYRLVDCLLAGTRWNSFHLVPASKQSTNLYDIYLMVCVQSQTPDDGRKDRLKRVKWYSVNSKIVHLVGFTIEIYHYARSHERQKSYQNPCSSSWVKAHGKDGQNEDNIRVCNENAHKTH